MVLLSLLLKKLTKIVIKFSINSAFEDLKAHQKHTFSAL